MKLISSLPTSIQTLQSVPTAMKTKPKRLAMVQKVPGLIFPRSPSFLPLLIHLLPSLLLGRICIPLSTTPFPDPFSCTCCSLCLETFSKATASALCLADFSSSLKSWPLLGSLSDSQGGGRRTYPGALCQPASPRHSTSLMAAGIGHCGAPRAQ